MSFFDVSDAEGVELEERDDEAETECGAWSDVAGGRPNFCGACDRCERMRWDDITSVEECVHGEHPLECSLCTSAGLHAAVSGQGDTMEDQDDVRDWKFDEWLQHASAKELRAGSYAIDREIARRKAENDRERKELEQFEKPVRKTRSDAGTTRARKEVAA